jgi:hypothetical protein
VRSLLAIVVLAACTKSDPPADRLASKTPGPAAPAKSASVAGWIELDTKQPLVPQLARESAAAIAAGKKPHAYLHADWCDPCVAIENTRATDERMKQAFASTHILAIDIDVADPKEMSALGLASSSIPVFYRLGPDGKPTGDRIDGGAWGDNIPENMAPPLTAFFAK